MDAGLGKGRSGGEKGRRCNGEARSSSCLVPKPLVSPKKPPVSPVRPSSARASCNNKLYDLDEMQNLCPLFFSVYFFLDFSGIVIGDCESATRSSHLIQLIIPVVFFLFFVFFFFNGLPFSSTNFYFLLPPPAASWRGSLVVSKWRVVGFFFFFLSLEVFFFLLG